MREQKTAMSKRKGEELAGPSRKKTTSQAGTSSRVTEEEDEDEMNLTQRADFDINSVWVIISNPLSVLDFLHSQRKLKKLIFGSIKILVRVVIFPVTFYCRKKLTLGLLRKSVLRISCATVV